MARMRFRPPPSHVAQPLSKCRFKQKALHLTRAQNLAPNFDNGEAIHRDGDVGCEISTTYKMAMRSALKKHPHGSTQSSRKNHSFILADD